MRKHLASLLLCGLLAGWAAAADWEWTQDKGWAQGAGRARETADEQLKYAWDLEQEKRYQNAARQYFLLLKSWPDSEEAGIGLQRLANCLFKLENYYDSFKALEQVIRSYPASIKKNDLLKIEFLIGRKFQTGARRDMLNMEEPAARGLETAIEIFQAVIANDSVGPYAGAAHLAVADCYRKMGDNRQAVVWYDRVLEQFSYSNELVAKAEMGKQLAKVALGEDSVESANVKRDQLAQMVKENDGGDAASTGSVDPEPVTNLREEFNELNEKEAEKLWKAAEYYRKRGSYESLQAYKFSLEQIIVRFPNTSYASEARKKIGSVKVPKQQPRSFGKINLPFVKKE
ncbi:MAG: tetratricopeptide repeat protein, partial [Planctomycetes bacterium]|nr:tetratricopeptide repeat protein [Planctomycetota bacterium]